jgi:transposase
MSGVCKVEISESAEALKQLLRGQKSASDQERVQLLYLLKSEQAKSVQAAAALLGRHRVTVQTWLRQYRQGGLAGLLTHKRRSGRKPSIPTWAQEALNSRLQEPEGFNSYGEICQWLESQLGITSPYKTVHKLVHYRLNASPKVARPVSVHHSEAAVSAYKKTSRRTSPC